MISAGPLGRALLDLLLDPGLDLDLLLDLLLMLMLGLLLMLGLGLGLLLLGLLLLGLGGAMEFLDLDCAPSAVVDTDLDEVSICSAQ